MTSVPIDQISILRDHRIRKEVTDESILSLAESISRLGLINPITVTRDNVLIAGETRLSACRRLGHTAIEVRYFEDLDEVQRLAIELEENIKRTDLPWQDQCEALVRYHELRQASDPNWRQEDTANSIGLKQPTVAKQLLVAQELRSGNERVVNAQQYTVARGIAERTAKRRAVDQENALLSIDGPKEQPKNETPIITMDFLDWAPSYSGSPFNLIHCDFPYGIDSDKNAEHKQFAAKSFGGYDDTMANHVLLRECLRDNAPKLCGDSCHIIFWFSMHNYQSTLDWLRDWIGWVDPVPLVWHKTAGIIPNPSMGPRRCYETAFLCSYGNRPIISSVSNIYQAKLTRDAEHMSEKSVEMLSHFMRMLVDTNTRMLDPTCGSGSSLRAARSLGAGSVLGLEGNPEYAALARKTWETDDQ